MPSADYIWPHTMNKKVREVVDGPRRRDRRRGVLPARPHRLRRGSSPTSWRRAPRSCSTRSSRPGSRRSSPSCTTPASQARRHVVCTYFDENFLNLVPAEHVEGLYGCLDYYRDVQDPFSIELLNRYERPLSRAARCSPPGRACTGTYRALKLWEAAVNEAGSLEAARRRRGARPRPHRTGARRPGRDGARAAPRADEHVHRPLRGRHVQGGREPWPHRPARADGPMTGTHCAPQRRGRC